MTGLFQNFKLGRAALALFSVLLGLLFAACGMFGTNLETFFEEQTGGITVGAAAPVAGKVAVGTDGYVCLETGQSGFSLPIDNPLGYELRVESSFTQTYGGIDGVTVSAAGTDSLAVHIPPGQTAGNEGVLHIKVTTAKEGRVLYEGDTGIAYLNFLDITSHLSMELSHNLALAPDFNPAVPNYSISNAPALFSIRAVAVADENAIGPLSPLITIDGMSEWGVLVRTITPAAGGSTVLMRVELPHGAAVKNYSFAVHPAGYGGATLVVQQAPAKTVYKVQSAENTGFDKTGLAMNYVSGGGSAPVDLDDPDLCAITYDFRTPGTKVVTVSYIDPLSGFTASGSFTVYVVGLSALTVTGPGPLAVITGPLGPMEAVPPGVPGDYTLASVPFGVSTFSVNAVSAVAGVTNASLTIAGAAAVSGTAKTTPLAVGSNTITIEVKLNRGSGSDTDKTETWTLHITRATLDTEDTFYVAGPAETLAPGRHPGSDGGDGTQTAPFATIKHALDLVKESGLGGAPGAEFTIIVSGKITDDTGSGTNGMAAITGSYPNGYPRIILKGIDAGTNAIDAAGKNKRVLYIADGNKLTLEAGLTLTGGRASSGGGVYVTGSGSTFDMTGGVIWNNTASGIFSYGGGVYVSDNGTFTVSGDAVIKDNASGDDGGGVYVTGSGSSFTMNGDAVIQHNTVSAFDGSGGGVSVWGGTFTMKENAVIKDNTVSSSLGYGGGVSVWGGIFIMKENAVIKDNTAPIGGGVCVSSSGIFTMSGAAVIQHNTASGSGGGVYVSDGTFTKTGGTIYGDTDHTPYPGNGNATDNTAGSSGNAVYLNGGKMRDTTVGTDATGNLYAAKYYGGSWSYVDPASGGLGNTEGNWDLP
jgi:hypothetical protein